MVTKLQVDNADYFYRQAISNWKYAKTRLNNSIQELRNFKNTLPLKKYIRVKHLTKQTRIELEKDIQRCFIIKCKAHDQKEQILQEYLKVDTFAIDALLVKIKASLTNEEIQILKENIYKIK